jgi:hypothetical protein
LFAANGNRKGKFVFLGRQTINGDWWLLFHKRAHQGLLHSKHMSCRNQDQIIQWLRQATGGKWFYFRTNVKKNSPSRGNEYLHASALGQSPHY